MLNDDRHRVPCLHIAATARVNRVKIKHKLWLEWWRYLSHHTCILIMSSTPNLDKGTLVQLKKKGRIGEARRNITRYAC